MLINAPVPDFSLLDLTGRLYHMSDYRGKIVVVNFWSAECPWSERADKQLLAVMDRLPDRLVVLPIASNMNESDEMINLAVQQRGLSFVLRDQSSKLADAWGAQTTPHAFVIDQSGILRYQGAIDDVTFRKRNPEHFYVEETLLALLEDRIPSVQDTPPYGCTIVRW